MNLLNFHHLCVSYGSVCAVHDVSFPVEQGDYLCVVGKNGSGKSSLIKAVFGLVPVVSGGVELAVDLSRIAYMPQRSSIPQNLVATVREVVLTGTQRKRGRPFYTKADNAQALSCLHTLGAASLSDRRIGELSGGQQQKVLLARALCRNPELLILDEPSAGLDEASALEFYRLLRVQNEGGVTILMVTHDRSEVLANAHRVAELDKTLLYYGDKNDWLAQKEEA